MAACSNYTTASKCGSVVNVLAAGPAVPVITPPPDTGLPKDGDVVGFVVYITIQDPLLNSERYETRVPAVYVTHCVAAPMTHFPVRVQHVGTPAVRDQDRAGRRVCAADGVDHRDRHTRHQDRESAITAPPAGRVDGVECTRTCKQCGDACHTARFMYIACILILHAC